MDISTDTTVNIIIITPTQILNNTASHYQPFYSFHHLFIIIHLNHSYSSYHILTTSATLILLIFNYTYFLHTLYIIPFILAKIIKIDNTFEHVSFNDLSKYILQSNQQLLFLYIPICYSYISYIHSFTQHQCIITNPSLSSYIAVFRHPFTDFIIIFHLSTLSFLALHILTLSAPFIFYSTALPIIYLIAQSYYHITWSTWSTLILLIFNYIYFLYILYIILFILAKNIKIDNTFDHVQSTSLQNTHFNLITNYCSSIAQYAIHIPLISILSLSINASSQIPLYYHISLYFTISLPISYLYSIYQHYHS